MQGEGDHPPLQRSGKGERAAQAERGSLGKPLARARGKHPLGAFAVAVAFQAIREGRCGEGTAPLRWVAKDVHLRPQTGRILPPAKNGFS